MRADIGEAAAHADRWFRELGLPDALVRVILRGNRKRIRGEPFTLGSYGKVGPAKGSFDLVEALGRLAEGGAAFSFVSLASGTLPAIERYCRAILNHPELAKRSWILPAIAPWRVPAFLRLCDAVCFLERDFPIQFHGPTIPREVLASGACLVCSAEIAHKPEYRGSLVDERTAIVVADPRDIAVLAERLRWLIADRDRARSIGGQGQRLSRFWENDLPSGGQSAGILARELERIAGRARRRSR